ncbi:MAG: rRNA pseudouridine synthase [Tannerella sp.]|jgi:23S rRNA pseudouridine2605 synthase|nr:rRNA pseudouridine synthase [Tannerella sp.]
MEIEKNDEIQPVTRRTPLEEQQGNDPVQGRNYERRPAYHATREGGAYQAYDSSKGAMGNRRPRIKDVRRINYNRPYGTPEDNTMERGERRSMPPRPYPSRSETGDRPAYRPRVFPPSGGGGEGYYPPQRNAPRYPQYGGERPQNAYPPRPNMEGGYHKRSRVGGYDAPYPSDNRSTYGVNRTGNFRPQSKQMRNKPPQKQKPKFPKPVKYAEALTDPNEPIRLNKFLANAGVCSRREADEHIQAGVVKVNGQVIKELGVKITRQDEVLFRDQLVRIEGKIYILLNKPKNCVTTSDDPKDRRTVMDLLRHACRERIYPVGRLDRNTTGVLLLTNDGELASKLTHPSFKKKKIYHVWLDKDVALEDMEKLANGITLDDGEIHADAISYASEDDKTQVGIEIHSGRNRIVRRMFESLGYHIRKLDRVYFAGLTKKNLGRGKWRYLEEHEVNALRIGAFD